MQKSLMRLWRRILLSKNAPSVVNGGGEITIPMTAYGCKSERAFIRCKYCGFETKGRNTNTTIYDIENKRIGCPTIEKSLMGAIYRAIEDWNGKGNGKQTRTSGNEAR